MKNWKKIALFGVSLATATLVLAGCSSQAGSKPVIQLSIPSDITTLDPTLDTDMYSFILNGNTEEGLTRVDDNGDAANAIAQNISMSKDGLTYTITLKSGLYWTNSDGTKGDKLTAQDFVYSWQRAVNPATGSQYAYLLSCLKNASDINSGKNKDLTSLGVKADSDTQLTVTLAQPTPYFKFLLAEPVFYPLDKTTVDKYGKAFGTSSDKMAYDGPFIFKKGAGWTGSNESFKLVKNPNYFDKDKVKSDEIDFSVQKNPQTAVNLYKSGKLDQVELTTPELFNANKNYTKNTVVVNEKESRTNYIEYNQTGTGTSSSDVAKALKNDKIREALNLATDRQTIVSTATANSTVATGMTPAGMAKTQTGQDFAAYAKQDYTFDPNKAKQLWEEGLKEVGLTSLNLVYETDTDHPSNKTQADFLQASWEKYLPGLKVTEKLVTFQQRLKDSENHSFDIVDSSWGGDYAEPTTFLQLFVAGSGYNDGGFTNDAYQTAMTKATALPDVNNAVARNADYKDAEAALYNSSNINPVYFETTPVLRNSNLKGLAFHGTGLIYDLKTAYLEK